MGAETSTNFFICVTYIASQSVLVRKYADCRKTHGMSNIQSDGIVCHGPGQPDALFRPMRNSEESVKDVS